VISIGNITTGGTGKTPLVEYVARIIASHGKKVCILTRGYGRKDPHLQVIVSDGYGVLASPSEAGDEPYLLATKLAGQAAVISSADRIAAGQEAIKDFGTEAFVLDDGFQHLRIARDLNIACIDATNPWGGGRLLPYGRLRESAEGLSRADCVVLTRCDQVESIAALREQVSELIEGRPIFESRMRPLRVVSLKKIPVASLTETAQLPENKTDAEKAKAQGAPLKETVYKHGVEITVQGAYLDMIGYMTELEGMPAQLFWGKARMSVDEYPQATLTLTLFTLSLDKKWLNI